MRQIERWILTCNAQHQPITDKPSMRSAFRTIPRCHNGIVDATLSGSVSRGRRARTAVQRALLVLCCANSMRTCRGMAGRCTCLRGQDLAMTSPCSKNFSRSAHPGRTLANANWTRSPFLLPSPPPPLLCCRNSSSKASTATSVMTMGGRHCMWPSASRGHAWLT